jgi:osmotically-inducible protein OsmY
MPRRAMMVLAVVVGAACQSFGTTRSSVDDGSITAAVKAKLVAERMTNITRVDVDTIEGTVYLSGIVDSPSQRATAEALARQVAGVKSVVNNLQIQKK